jgi:hypothetical protein
MANRGEIMAGGPRLPLEPLADIIHRRGLTFSSFGEAGSRSLHRYQSRGLTYVAADEWACRLGMHPLEIWGSAFDEVSLNEEA